MGSTSIFLETIFMFHFAETIFLKTLSEVWTQRLNKKFRVLKKRALLKRSFLEFQTWEELASFRNGTVFFINTHNMACQPYFQKTKKFVGNLRRASSFKIFCKFCQTS